MNDMSGLIGTVVGAGVVMKITNSMFPTPQQPSKSRVYHSKSKKKKNGRYGHPGNFNNVGL